MATLLSCEQPRRPRGCESILSQGGRAPGDIILQDLFQTVAVVLVSDRCQKIFVFFCPIRVKYALESFRVEMYKKLTWVDYALSFLSKLREKETLKASLWKYLKKFSIKKFYQTLVFRVKFSLFHHGNVNVFLASIKCQNNYDHLELVL